MQIFKPLNISFRYLDVAQLIKHYFGLAHEYVESDQNLEIGYVFWEPDKKGALPDPAGKLYEDHRQECYKFASLVSGDKIRFSFYSYFDLIKHWRGIGVKSELINHFEMFEEKYKIYN